MILKFYILILVFSKSALPEQSKIIPSCFFIVLLPGILSTTVVFYIPINIQKGILLMLRLFENKIIIKLLYAGYTSFPLLIELGHCRVNIRRTNNGCIVHFT